MRPSPRLPLALLVSLVSSSGCSGGATSAPSDAEAHPEVAQPVVAGQPLPNPWPRIVVLHGQLEARETVQLAARVEGPVDRVDVDLGDEVRAGRSLASLVSVDFRARASQASAELAQARSNLARFEGLGPQSVAAQEIEQARTAVAVAQSELELANRQVSDARVRAPFDGIVARRYVSRGAFVHVGDPLFDFVSTGPMKLTLEVPEAHAREVRLGQKIRVLTEASAGEGFEAEVARVSPVVSAGTRTFRIEAVVDPHEGRLRPGMFVLATLELGMDAEAVRIPRGAVYSVLGHDRVTLVVAGRAEVRDVELLGELNGNAIVHGIAPSDVVVLRGGGALAPGVSVRPTETAPEPPATPPAPVRDAGTPR